MRLVCACRSTAEVEESDGYAIVSTVIEERCDRPRVRLNAVENMLRQLEVAVHAILVQESGRDRHLNGLKIELAALAVQVLKMPFEDRYATRVVKHARQLEAEFECGIADVSRHGIF